MNQSRGIYIYSLAGTSVAGSTGKHPENQVVGRESGGRHQKYGGWQRSGWQAPKIWWLAKVRLASTQKTRWLAEKVVASTKDLVVGKKPNGKHMRDVVGMFVKWQAGELSWLAYE